MQLLQEAAASTSDMTRMERRARFWNLPPLGDERDNEIPGAGPTAQPVDPAALGGGFPVPNMQNAAPAPVRTLVLSKNALADLRRWKDVTIKSIKENSEPRLEFISDHIPFDVRVQVLSGLTHAETPDQVKSIFAPWMPGEASTKASLFPLTGTGLSTHKDDPFLHVKRMTESELEQALREYFAGLAVRVGEQVEEPTATKAFASAGELKHPGHPDQSVHGRKRGGGADENTVGFSFLSGDTRLDSTSKARDLGNSPDGWDKHEIKFKNKYLKQFDLEDDIERTLGFWGGPEPSFNAHLVGKRENVEAMAKSWAKEHNQQGMALLFPNTGGTGGKLKWDFGKELSDSEMDSFFKNLDDLNKQHGEEFNDYFGVTVKGSRNIEYWHKSESQGKNARYVIDLAMEKTKLPAKFSKERGYDFVLLEQGKDYE